MGMTSSKFYGLEGLVGSYKDPVGRECMYLTLPWMDERLKKGEI